MTAFKEELKKGTFINSLGIVGKISGPALLIIVNQLYGTAVFGIYITANMLIEIILSFLTNGFKDGALIYVSKYSDRKGDKKKLYQSLSNSIAWSVLFAIFSLLIIIPYSELLFMAAYEIEYVKLLNPVFQIMAIGLPIMAFERIVIAATQGLKIMKFDALVNGGFRPLFLLIGSISFYYIEPSAIGIAYGYLCTQFVLMIYSLYVFNLKFEWKYLIQSFINFNINYELIRFSIPQSLNSSLNRFITGIDILMLPAFGVSALEIGIYGTGSQIIREVRHIKLAFSATFNPHIVKFHRDNDVKGLSSAYAITSSWITAITIPFLTVLWVFHADIINMISSVPVNNTLFMLLLLPVPYFYASFSLSGNIVVMTGNSLYVLFNSILITFLNICFNLILIPLYGLSGAAIASSISVIIISILEIYEAHKVANLKFHIPLLSLPHIAGFISMALLILLQNYLNSNLINNLFITIITLLIFGVLYFLGYKKIAL